jgi:ribosomal protein S12 methylthiotransferase accessory factor
MLSRPIWKATCHVEVIDETTVLLLDERDYAILNGRVFPLLVPLLDGRRTLTELFDSLSQVSPAELSYSLELAEAQGYILDADTTVAPECVAFWHALGVDLPTVSARLQEACVRVQALGELRGEALTKVLDPLGVRTGEEGNFLVVLSDDYLRPELEAINREALASGRPWMLARPVGNTVWLGPVFRPAQTACWSCLAQRLRSNRQLEHYLERRKGRSEPVRLPISLLPSTVHAALHLTAQEVAKAVVLGGKYGLDGQVLTLDVLTLETQRHELVRRPQCPDCSDGASLRREPEPIVLHSRQKRFDQDGGHRSVPPEITYERLKKHVSPITGVVRNLEQVGTQKEEGLLYSYSAGHNFALMNQDLRFILGNLRGRSGGKGMTDLQARVSAICEAIERYSGVYRGDEPGRYASFMELGEQAVYPNTLMGFSQEQYEHRTRWNATHDSGFHQVPEAFDERRRVHWAPVWSLTDERVRYVPSAYCYFGHPELREWFFCTSDSNGNAAGNTREEAILQGFMELVERDCVALWWYNQVRRPGVSLDSFGEPYVRALQAHYERLGRQIWVLDLTADLGITTFAAVSRRTDSPVEDIVVGFGAHFDPRVALLRALTEVNQFLPAVSRRDANGNTLYWFPEKEAIRWWKTATVAHKTYLLPDPQVPERRLSDFSNHSSGDLKTDVETCVDFARRRGLETLVLDQTQPDIGLSVVKVMVPGLRHFWMRFGPGRLYDVPVRLGWLAAPLREEQLNPVGVFF